MEVRDRTARYSLKKGKLSKIENADTDPSKSLAPVSSSIKDVDDSNATQINKDGRGKSMKGRISSVSNITIRCGNDLDKDLQSEVSPIYMTNNLKLVEQKLAAVTNDDKGMRNDRLIKVKTAGTSNQIKPENSSRSNCTPVSSTVTPPVVVQDQQWIHDTHHKTQQHKTIHRQLSERIKCLESDVIRNSMKHKVEHILVTDLDEEPPHSVSQLSKIIKLP